MIVAFSYYGEEIDFMSEGDTNPADLKIENSLKKQIDDKERKVSSLQKSILKQDNTIKKLRHTLKKLGATKIELYGAYGDDDGSRRKLAYAREGD